MRWSRYLVVAIFLGLMGCSSATGPEYPQQEEDKGGERDPDKSGMVIYPEPTDMLVIHFDGGLWA